MSRKPGSGGTDRDALGEPGTCISVRACHAISDKGVKSSKVV